MADIRVTFGSVSIPSGAETTLTVYEDVGGDGSGPNSVTVDGQTIQYENSASTTLSNGQTEYILSGFDVSFGNEYYPRIEPDSSADLEQTGEHLQPLTVEPAGVSAPAINLTLQTPAPDIRQTPSPDTVALALTVDTPAPSIRREDIGESWVAYLPGENETEPALFDVQVQDTVNPFGSYAVLKIDDTNGDAFGRYPRGKRVDVYVTPPQDGTTRRRFSGYVVERRPQEQAGADVLEVELYTFDQFLRKGIVSSSTDGQTLEDTLQQIITEDTPVTYDSAQVTVGEPQQVTQELRGEEVENAIRRLSDKSVNEEFGVDRSNTFFFRPAETGEADRALEDGDILGYDFPERGKRAVNEVTVYYRDGDRSVRVANDQDKEDLQGEIDTGEPVKLEAEIHRHDTEKLVDAKDEGRKYLSEREPVRTGTIRTFGLFATEPGDVISVSYTPADLDGQYKIAALEYRWGRAETEITVVEKRGNQDDLLVNLSDSVKRTERRGTNRDGTADRVTSTAVGHLVDASITVSDGSTSQTGEAVLTNTARNLLRDGWAGAGPIEVDEIAVGTGHGSLNRTQTALDEETDRVAVSGTATDTSSEVAFEASVSGQEITEVGIFDTSGRLIARGLLDGATFGSATVTVSFTVSNDASRQGVMTDAGIESTKNLLGGSYTAAPELPAEYAYGSGGGDPDPSDTALATEEVRVEIDELLVQSAATESEWEGIIDTAGATDSEDPLTAAGGTVTVRQTAFTVEAEDATTLGPGGTSAPANFFGTAYSGDGVTNGEGVTHEYSGSGEAAEYEFTLAYDVPDPHFDIALRLGLDGTTTSNPTRLELSLDGQTLGDFSTGTGGLTWLDASQLLAGFDGQALSAGTHTLRIESTAAETDDQYVDVVVPYDNRFSYTFDNAVTTAGDGTNYLDGPEFYPDLTEVVLATQEAPDVSDSVTVDQTWSDTSAGQYIDLSNDGGSTYQRLSNTASGTATFGTANDQLKARLGISRYGSQTDTPGTGYLIQEVSTHELLAGLVAIRPEDTGVTTVATVIDTSAQSLAGTTISEAGQIGASGSLLSRTVFAPFDITQDRPERLLTDESVRWRND